MDNTREQRREERLSYQWPVWFSEDFQQSVNQGLMVDVSSGGLAFTYEEEDKPYSGQMLIMRFSIPRADDQDSSALASITRSGRVCRVDEIGEKQCRVAVQFDKPLSLKPCEQAGIDLMLSRDIETQ